QQRLIGGLFGRQGGGQWVDGVVVRRIRQVVGRFFHLLFDGPDEGLAPGIVHVLFQRAGLLERLLLRLLHDRHIFLVGRGGCFGRLLFGSGGSGGGGARSALTLKFPGRIDDLLLQLGQFLCPVPGALLAATLHLRAFTENLLKRTDLGEEHVARG